MLSTTLLTLSVLSLTSTFASSHWSYNDATWCSAEHWYCCPQYTTQSPIDIDTMSDNALADCPVSDLDWELGTTTTFTMVNTGHSLKATPKHADNQGTLVINEKKYCLAQFHVHWGEIATKGSEHTINTISASLEMHFVHYLCSEGSIANAMETAEDSSGDDRYTLAVVSVLYISDPDFKHHESALLNDLISHASDIGTCEAEYEISGSSDMTTLVRDTVGSNPVYYYYKGSLTTPDCNPFVHWNVLRDPMYVSSDMLSTLRSTIADEDGVIIEKNYRAAQNNKNPVCLCGGGDDDSGDKHHPHFQSESDD